MFFNGVFGKCRIKVGFVVDTFANGSLFLKCHRNSTHPRQETVTVNLPPYISVSTTYQTGSEIYGTGITAADLAMSFLGFTAEYAPGDEAETRSHEDVPKPYPGDSGVPGIHLPLQKGTDPKPDLVVGSYYNIHCWIGVTSQRGSPIEDVTIELSSLSLGEVDIHRVGDFIIPNP